MTNIEIEASVMGSMQASVEFMPEVNNEHMAMLEADMRFNRLNDIRTIVLEDSIGGIVGKLIVNDIDFEWERFFAKGEVW